MKVLFVTGGEDCECKGDGFESVTLYPWGLGKDPKTGEPRSVTTRILCSCVEAREATIEVDSVEGRATRHAARVVPRGQP